MVEAEYGICACPACDTRFRVTEAQLGAAGGQVRCGACLALFNARTALASASTLERPTPAFAPQPLPAASVPPATPMPSPPAPVPPAPAPLPAHPPELRPAVAPRRRSPPDSYYSRPPVAWRLVLVLLLGVGLAASALALMADGWALRPDLRPRYQQACELLGNVVGPPAACELPRALTSFEVSAPLGVERTDPPATLALKGRMVNQAAFPQPAPTLLVRLEDANEATVSQHRLAPKDYLAEAPEAFGADQAADLAIRVPDPGPEAVGVTLTLL